MERRRSESRRREQAESQWNWSTTFPRLNLNDLHLRSLKLKIKLQTGPFGYKSIGLLIFNDYEHRRGGRSILQPCCCLTCTPWRKLIENPSVPIETELPLTILNK
ncbi:hypothetical protein ANCDUO_07497 [Ancylostoma duodenale]|uniref:Uncharacterized protein n=1 Tax=Ancylostoma duodenale TaxID=51022 RepID=A0A0C2DIC2_9BILA|nr:hypothetical protein ANCDUO_07497 [Ancylostoma duodenale]